MKSHYLRIIVAIVLAIVSECAADELSEASDASKKSNELSANAARMLAQNAVAIDPSDIDIDAVESDTVFDLLEKTFSRYPKTRRVLPHFRRYFAHLCDTELRQLHSLANLKRSEFVVLQNGLRDTARRAVLKMCQDQLRSTQAGATVGKNKTSTNRLIEDTLIELTQRELTSQQAKLYRKGVLNRRNFRQDAVVESMAASLDTHLLLSVEQREQIIKILQNAWQDQWLLSTKQLISSGIESVPMLPMPQIRNVLRPPQIKVFASLKWRPKTVVFGGSSQVVKVVHNAKLNGKIEDALKFAPEETGASK